MFLDFFPYTMDNINVTTYIITSFSHHLQNLFLRLMERLLSCDVFLKTTPIQLELPSLHSQ